MRYPNIRLFPTIMAFLSLTMASLLSAAETQQPWSLSFSLTVNGQSCRPNVYLVSPGSWGNEWRKHIYASLKASDSQAALWRLGGVHGPEAGNYTIHVECADPEFSMVKGISYAPGGKSLIEGVALSRARLSVAVKTGNRDYLSWTYKIIDSSGNDVLTSQRSFDGWQVFYVPNGKYSFVALNRESREELFRREYDLQAGQRLKISHNLKPDAKTGVWKQLVGEIDKQGDGLSVFETIFLVLAISLLVSPFISLLAFVLLPLELIRGIRRGYAGGNYLVFGFGVILSVVFFFTAPRSSFFIDFELSYDYLKRVYFLLIYVLSIPGFILTLFKRSPRPEEAALARASNEAGISGLFNLFESLSYNVKIDRKTGKVYDLTSIEDKGTGLAAIIIIGLIMGLLFPFYVMFRCLSRYILPLISDFCLLLLRPFRK